MSTQSQTFLRRDLRLGLACFRPFPGQAKVNNSRDPTLADTCELTASPRMEPNALQDNMNVVRKSPRLQGEVNKLSNR